MALDPVAWSVSLTLELAIRTETEKRGEGRGVLSAGNSPLAGQAPLNTGPVHGHVFCPVGQKSKDFCLQQDKVEKTF